MLALQLPRQRAEYTFTLSLGRGDLLLDFGLFFNGLFGATRLSRRGLDLCHERAFATRHGALDTASAWWLTNH